MSCPFQEGERCKQIMRGKEAPKGPVAARNMAKQEDSNE